jgi:hypothetical protein
MLEEEPEVDGPAQWLGVRLNRLAIRLPLPHLDFLDSVRDVSVVTVIDAWTGT